MCGGMGSDRGFRDNEQKLLSENTTSSNREKAQTASSDSGGLTVSVVGLSWTKFNCVFRRPQSRTESGPKQQQWSGCSHTGHISHTAGCLLCP